MDAVAHFVGRECALQFLDNFFAWRKIENRQRARRFFESIEMFYQFKDATVVEPQAFPNRVTALDRGIERTDPGLVAVDQFTVDVNDQVFVLRIKLLLHGKD